jgi:hypothetical protein
MKLLSKLGKLLPYFMISKAVNALAPWKAELVFGDNKINVYVIRMSNDEWIVRRRK